MKTIFVGAQGSGKGTQAKIIAEKLKLCHISTGDLLREVQGELKEKVESYMNSGELVPDQLILELLKQKITEPDCEKGFILDGFPRNIEQAKALDKITDIDKVIEIQISDDQAINRITNRIGCTNCGAIYNKKTNPPKKENICDFCDASLKARVDDNPEAIKKRLETYHNQTEPILEHYDSAKINGQQDIEKVTQDILKVLE